MISEILRKELDRFEKTKGKEMSKSLKDYAKENMDTTVQVPFAFVISLPLSASSWSHLRSSFLPAPVKILDQWKKLLNQLQTASI
jgi:hypothetical protein